MKQRLSIVISWLTSLFVAGVFVGLTYVEQLSPLIARYVLPVAFVVLPLVTALVTFFMRGIHAKVPALLAAATPFVLMIGGLGAYVVAEGYWTRMCIGAASVGGLSLFLAYWRGMSRGEARFRNEDFAHLTLALHVFAMFFLLTTSFGVTDFLHLPVAASAFVVAMLALVTGAETMRRSAVPSSFVWPFSIALATIVGEGYVAISMLPTGNLVNALVGTVLYAATLHAALSALSASQLSNRLGRQFALSLAVVTLVLSTARWA